MVSNDDSCALIERVKQAVAEQSPLRITGGDSKYFLGNTLAPSEAGSELSCLSHSGVVSYEPTELVITVRCGTRLSDLNHALDEAGQMLPFEPPEFPGGTIGGVLAAGMSGPRRPFQGSARDYVLGTRVINGKAQDLAFGGKVMKNVAGYDISRLQVGAWGTLGVLLDVSMKVLPKPESEVTLQQSVSEPGDLSSLLPLMRKPLPLSAAMVIGSELFLRLSGSASAVDAAARELGGDRLADGAILWSSVRNHTHEFFTIEKPLWRISVPDYAPAIDLPGQWLYDWAGAQRWLKADLPAEQIFTAAEAAGGHAMRYTPADVSEPAFQPLTGAMQRLQMRVRDSFDPQRLFNRGRFHPELDHLTSAHAGVQVDDVVAGI